MKELHDGLAKVGWLHAFCTRPGQHSLAVQDVDASVHFFKRDSEGSLKASAVGYYGCEGGTVAAPESGGGSPPPSPTPPPPPPRPKE